MLISPLELQANWNVSASGVLHVGAHEAEEAPLYAELNWTPVFWVEAQPALAQKLKARLDPLNNRVISSAIWDVSGNKMTLHITSNSQSTSLLDLGSHRNTYPEISKIRSIEVKTERLDDLIAPSEMPNFINLDIQGAELKALQSLGDLIDEVKYIYIEVNWREVYKDCARVWQIDEYLKDFGFSRATTRWFISAGWGDALYLKGARKHRSMDQKYRNLKIVARFYINQILDVVKKPIAIIRRRASPEN